ncbi:cupin domain-containing protein [Streptomyces indicus]|uniref:cupin domain-containing protein n=1 Tax=Streptomyces indicus TaxID=417292 RepID=UPI000B8125EE|nr:cupin domain-containing protein [Streptomyces indicus]
MTRLTREEFARDHWSRAPLLTRAADDFGDLFSADAVDELIARRGLRTPFLRVAKDGATLPEASFTSPAGVGASIGDQLDDTALWRSFADGATLVLQALHRTWEPVADLAARLGTELGHPVQANAYITPPQNRGFDDHYDVHDVFVLQIAGTKRWMIHEPVHPDPLRDQPWTDHRAAVAQAAKDDPYLDTVLEPGDVLYLPRGWLHAAQAQGAVSIHLTLGVHTWTRHALAEQLAQSALALLREDPEMRASLPLGAEGPGADLDLVRRRLVAALTETDPAPLFHRARRAQARPAPLGPLAQLAALKGLTPDTQVRLREALEARLDGRRLRTRAGWLDFPEDELPAVTVLLDGRPHAAYELGLGLAERLLRAGVAVPDGS